MAKDDEDLDLDFGDELDFNMEDGDMDFDFGTENANKKDRKPQEVLRDGLKDGFKSQYSADELEKVADKVFPEKLVGTKDNIKDYVSNSITLFEESRQELTKEYNKIKATTAKVLPVYEKVLPEKLRNIIKSWADDREDEYQSQRMSEEQQQQEMLQSELSKFTDIQVEFQKQSEARELLREQAEGKRFESQQDLLYGIKTGIGRVSGYQEQVASKFYLKSIELQHYQLFTQRRISETLLKSAEHTKAALDALVKNSALPDIVKAQNREVLKDVGLRRIAEFASNKIGDYTSNFKDKLFKNANDYVKGVIGGIRDGSDMIRGGIEQVAEMQTMMADMGEAPKSALEHAGVFAGSNIANFINTKVLGGLASKLDKNGNLSALGLAGEDLFKYLPQWLNKWKKNGEDKGFLGNLLADLIPGSSDNELSHRLNAFSELKKSAEFDNATRKSIVDIIPALLAKIHLSTEGIRTHLAPTQRLNEDNLLEWDHDTSTLTTRKTLDDRISEKAKVVSGLKAQMNYALNIVDIIDPGFTLPENLRATFAKEIVHTLGKHQGFSHIDFIHHKWREKINEADIEIINNLIAKRFGMGKSQAELMTKEHQEAMSEIKANYDLAERQRGMIQDYTINRSTATEAEAARLARLNLVEIKNGITTTNTKTSYTTELMDEINKTIDYSKRKEDFARGRDRVDVSPYTFKEVKGYEATSDVIEEGTVPNPRKEYLNGKPRLTYLEWVEYRRKFGELDDEEERAKEKRKTLIDNVIGYGKTALDFAAKKTLGEEKTASLAASITSKIDNTKLGIESGLNKIGNLVGIEKATELFAATGVHVTQMALDFSHKRLWDILDDSDIVIDDEKLDKRPDIKFLVERKRKELKGNEDELVIWIKQNRDQKADLEWFLGLTTAELTHYQELHEANEKVVKEKVAAIQEAVTREAEKVKEEATKLVNDKEHRKKRAKQAKNKAKQIAKQTGTTVAEIKALTKEAKEEVERITTEVKKRPTIQAKVEYLTEELENINDNKIKPIIEKQIAKLKATKEYKKVVAEIDKLKETETGKKVIDNAAKVRKQVNDKIDKVKNNPTVQKLIDEGKLTLEEVKNIAESKGDVKTKVNKLKKLAKDKGKELADVSVNKAKEALKEGKQNNSILSQVATEVSHLKEAISEVTDSFKEGLTDDTIVASGNVEINRQEISKRLQKRLSSNKPARRDVRRGAHIRNSNVNRAAGYVPQSTYINNSALSEAVEDKDNNTPVTDTRVEPHKLPNAVTDEIKKPTDVYVRGEQVPRLLADKLEAGEYYLADTGKIINSPDEITGAVKDRDGNMVITPADLKKGFVDNKGESVGLDFKAVPSDRLLGTLSKAYKGGTMGMPKLMLRVLSKPLRMTMTTTDIYLPGDPPVLVMTRWGMMAFQYRNEDGSFITSVRDIKGTVYDNNNNVIITAEQVKAGLVDKYGKPIRGYLIRRARVAARGIKAAAKATKWLADKTGVTGAAKLAAGTAWQATKGTYKTLFGGPEGTESYVTRRAKAAGSMIDATIGEYGYKPAGKLIGKGFKKAGKKINKWMGEPFRTHGGRVETDDGIVVDPRTGKARKNNYRDEMKAQDEATEARKKRSEEAHKKEQEIRNKKKSGTSILDYLKKYLPLVIGGIGSLVSFGAGTFDAIKSLAVGFAAYKAWRIGSAVVEGVKNVASAVTSTAKTVGKIAKGAWNLGKGAWNLGKSVLGIGGNLAKAAGQGYVSTISKVGAKVAPNVTTKVTQTLAKKGLETGLKFGAKRLAVGALAFLGPIAAAAALAYTLYEIGSFVWDLFQQPNKVEDFKGAAYGMNPESEYRMNVILEFEGWVAKHVKYEKNGTVQLPNLANYKDDKDLAKIIGAFAGGKDGLSKLQAAEENVQKEYGQRFTEWYNTRFSPAFVQHYASLMQIDDKIDYNKAFGRWGTGDLKDGLVYSWARRAYFKADDPENPYGNMVDPFFSVDGEDANEPMLANQDIVDKYYNIVKDAYEGDEKRLRAKDKRLKERAASKGEKYVSEFEFENQTKRYSRENHKTEGGYVSAYEKAVRQNVINKDGSKANVLVQGNTTYLLSNSIDVQLDGRGIISDGDAIRMRLYGLSTLVDSRVKTLINIEAQMVDKLVFKGDDTCVFSGFDYDALAKVYGVLLGWDINNPEDYSKFKAWFEYRFSPVFQALAARVNLLTKNKNILIKLKSMTHEQLFSVYIDLVGIKTKINEEEISIWDVPFGPVKGLEPNKNSGTVTDNLVNLEQARETQILTEKDPKKSNLKNGEESSGATTPHHTISSLTDAIKTAANSAYNAATQSGSSGSSNAGSYQAPIANSTGNEAADSAINAATGTVNQAVSYNRTSGGSGEAAWNLSGDIIKMGNWVRTVKGKSLPGLDKYGDMITRLANEAGVDPAIFLAKANIESGFNPTVGNDYYGGLFAIDKKKHAGKWQDPEYNTREAIKLYFQNKKVWERRFPDVPYSAGISYLLHQQGPGGGPALYAAKDTNKSAAEVLKTVPQWQGESIDWIKRKIIKANGAPENISAGDFARMWMNRGNALADFYRGKTGGTVSTPIDSAAAPSSNGFEKGAGSGDSFGGGQTGGGGAGGSWSSPSSSGGAGVATSTNVSGETNRSTSTAVQDATGTAPQQTQALPNVGNTGGGGGNYEWLKIAHAEIGQAESGGNGGRSNPRILEYIKTTNAPSNTDQLPWCSCFVNWVMEKAGYKGTKSAAAVSWKSWSEGQTLPKPAYGCLAIFKTEKGHHVGFVIGRKKHKGENGVALLGGNQSNQVKVSGYRERLAIAFVLPKGITPIYDIPEYTGSLRVITTAAEMERDVRSNNSTRIAEKAERQALPDMNVNSRSAGDTRQGAEWKQPVSVNRTTTTAVNEAVSKNPLEQAANKTQGTMDRGRIKRDTVNYTEPSANTGNSKLDNMLSKATPDLVNLGMKHFRPTYSNDLKKNANVEMMQPAFMKLLYAAIGDYVQQNGAASFGSNQLHRTHQDQVIMKQIHGSGAAIPGTSNHGWGRAVDLNNEGTGTADRRGLTEKFMRTVGPKWGFFNAVKGEWWHLENRFIGKPKGKKNGEDMSGVGPGQTTSSGGGTPDKVDQNNVTDNAAKSTQPVKQPPTPKQSAPATSSSSDSSQTTTTTTTPTTPSASSDTRVASGAVDNAKAPVGGETAATKATTNATSSNSAAGTGNLTMSGAGGTFASVPKPKGSGTWAGVKDTILAAAKIVGVDPGLMAGMSAQESGLQPAIKAKGSTAGGLFQFLDGTWKGMMQAYGNKFGIPAGTSKFDGAANSLLGAQFIKDNIEGLKKVNKDVMPGDAYLAHFLGLGGAKKALRAGNDKIAASVFPKEAAKNKELFGGNVTIGGLRQRLTSKMIEKHKAFKIDVPIGDGSSYLANIDTSNSVTEPRPTPTSGIPNASEQVNQNTANIDSVAPNGAADANRPTYTSSESTSSGSYQQSGRVDEQVNALDRQTIAVEAQQKAIIEAQQKATETIANILTESLDVQKSTRDYISKIVEYVLGKKEQPNTNTAKATNDKPNQKSQSDMSVTKIPPVKMV